MNELEAKRILGTLRTELAETRAAALAAEKRAAALSKLIEGYVELFPGLADQPAAELLGGGDRTDPRRPRGQEAVRQVMAQNVGKWYTVKRMTRELAERGWLPESEQPENAVRTALTRIAETHPNVRKGVGEKTRQVTFAWFAESKPALPSPAPATSNGHDGLES